MPTDLYVIVAALAVNGIILLIINNAFRECSMKKRGLAALITSLLLMIIYSVAFLIDYINQWVSNFRYYLYFIGISLLYLLTFALPILIKGFKHGYGEKRKEKLIYTYHKKEEHVYIIYKYNIYLYLNKETLTGIDYIIKGNEFTDDVLNKINDKYHAIFEGDIERIGMVTEKGDKVDKVYYCYLINLTQELDDKQLELHSIYEIPNLFIPEFDKYIILNSLIGEYFEKIR